MPKNHDQKHRVGNEKEGCCQDPGQMMAIPCCPFGTMNEWKVVVRDMLPVIVEQCLVGVPTSAYRRHNGKVDGVWSCLRWSLLPFYVIESNM